MPQQSYTNGYTNGHPQAATAHYEMEDGQKFLFTSESVGEGHPGEFSILEIYTNSKEVFLLD